MSYRYVNDAVVGYYPSKHLAKGEALEEDILMRNFKQGEFCYQIGMSSQTENEYIVWGDVKCGVIKRESLVMYDEEEERDYEATVLRVDDIIFNYFNNLTLVYQNSEWRKEDKRYLIIFKDVEKSKYKEIDVHNVDLETYSLQELKLIARSRSVRLTKEMTKERLIQRLEEDYRAKMFNTNEYESRERAIRNAIEAACDRDTGFCAPQALAHAMDIPLKTLNDYLIREGFRQKREGMADDLIMWAANHFGFTLKDRTNFFEKYVKRMGKFKQVELYKTNMEIKRPEDVCCNLFHFDDFKSFFNPRLSYLIFSTGHVSAVAHGQLYDAFRRRERVERVVEVSRPKEKKLQKGF